MTPVDLDKSICNLLDQLSVLDSVNERVQAQCYSSQPKPTHRVNQTQTPLAREQALLPALSSAHVGEPSIPIIICSREPASLSMPILSPIPVSSSQCSFWLQSSQSSIEQASQTMTQQPSFSYKRNKKYYVITHGHATGVFDDW